MKKGFFSLLALCLLLCLCFSLSSCQERNADNGKIKIVCTLFPQYDWLSNIVGNSDTVELSLLVSNGADIHSYQPTAMDIMKIADCDMIVYGGDNELWVNEAIERSGRQDIRAIATAQIEGVTLRQVSSSSHTHEHGHSHEHNHTVDEHLWLSLKNAITISEALCEEVCMLDEENAVQYQKNTEQYINELLQLDRDFEESTREAKNKFMIFADRFPFVYLLSDYEIEYSAAFEGCTTDADADFDTVVRLIEESELHNAKYLAVCENANLSLAKTVIGSAKHAKMEIVVLNSLQAVTREQIDNGISYISAMRENLKIIQAVIN